MFIDEVLTVDLRGIEPRPTLCHSVVLPLNYRPCKTPLYTVNLLDIEFLFRYYRILLMIFKDRVDAGNKLSELLLRDKFLQKHKDRVVIISLLRGGFIVGKQIAQAFGSLPRNPGAFWLRGGLIPLVVVKIVSPDNPELAIGALCGKTVYKNTILIDKLRVNAEQLKEQIIIAAQKQKEYLHTYKLNKIRYSLRIKNKIAILVDDGIATGASIYAAAKFISLKHPDKLILASPVAPRNFESLFFDRVCIFHVDPNLLAVSQYYEEFLQVKNKEIDLRG